MRRKARTRDDDGASDNELANGIDISEAILAREILPA
jgi:hypothetical protein